TASIKRVLPQRIAQIEPEAKEIQIAKNVFEPQGLILDYSIVYSPSYGDPFTFEAGQTYLLTNTAYFPAVTFEGGAVLKYTDDGCLRVSQASNVVCKSSAYSPVT